MEPENTPRDKEPFFDWYLVVSKREFYIVVDEDGKCLWSEPKATANRSVDLLLQAIGGDATAATRREAMALEYSLPATLPPILLEKIREVAPILKTDEPVPKADAGILDVLLMSVFFQQINPYLPNPIK